MNILESKNLFLRALEPEDLSFLYDTENNTDFWKVSETLKPFSKYILKKYLENSHLDIFEAKQLRLVIVKKDTEERIGMIDLFDYHPKHQRAGIGILILKEYQNQGYARESLEIFIKYAFTFIGLHQIYANIPVNNKKSISLFESMNFKRSGVKEDWIKKETGFINVAFYQLINQLN
ncbi:MAG: GNAT family N-acetyltransferase [Flavobacteriia bacterium]|nr:MAG: GNAT family N-acetyltransferase [Flavobacteriia bacterium]